MQGESVRRIPLVFRGYALLVNKYGGAHTLCRGLHLSPIANLYVCHSGNSDAKGFSQGAGSVQACGQRFGDDAAHLDKAVYHAFVDFQIHRHAR